MKRNLIVVAFALTSLIPAHTLAADSGKTLMMWNKHIRLICVSPCPQEFTRSARIGILKNFTTRLNRLEKAMKYPLPASLKPVDVYISIGEVCKDMWKRDSNRPRNYTDQRNGKAVICFNNTTENILKGLVATTHELTHHYFWPMPQDEDSNTAMEEIVNSSTLLAEDPKSKANFKCPPGIQDTEWLKYLPSLCNFGYNFAMLPKLSLEYSYAVARLPKERQRLNQSELISVLSKVIGRDVSSAFAR